MSNWQIKSDYSFDSANKLIDVGLFNPSVHSSYYACVQYVFHIMSEYFGEEIEDIEGGSKTFASGLGTHVWLKKYIYNSMKSSNKPAAVDFRNSMGDLSGLRVQADYYYNIIEEREANNCHDMAIEIVALLKKHYEI